MRTVTVLLAVSAAAMAETGPFHWRGSVAQGRAIELRSVNGDIIVEGYDGSEVEVTANIASESGVAAPVAMRAVEHAKGVTVCAVDPRSAAACVPGSEIRQPPKGTGVRIDLTVRVPRGVGVIGRTVNGRVEAQRLDSDVEAYTVNGKIYISTKGSAQARTINGSIFASLGNPFWRQNREFSTVNGSITLDLPAKASTEIHAQTTNGRVMTAFRLRSLGRITEKVVDGLIGGGGSRLHLKTVNGSIALRKAS
ncbi:MAG TPA: hypothetical protein VFL57_02185 [Bryobacteraceae bacterium]|nr:hypothetical protein [Bryobacteraceae bacterium]